MTAWRKTAIVNIQRIVSASVIIKAFQRPDEVLPVAAPGQSANLNIALPAGSQRRRPEDRVLNAPTEAGIAPAFAIQLAKLKPPDLLAEVRAELVSDHTAAL
jgi:hypothetical protein